MLNQKSMLRGYVFAVLSAVIYGCMPLMAKFIYAEGVNAMTLVFLRNALALPSLAVLGYLQQKSLAVTPRHFAGLGIPAFLGCALTPVLLFSSYQYLASGVATVFHFVYPSLVLILGFVFLKRKVTLSTLISVLLCFAGIALFFDPSEPLHFTGVLLSLASGLTFALYVLVLPRFKKGTSVFVFSFYVALWSSIIMLFACLVSGQLALPVTFAGWGLCILFAMSVTTGAVVLFQQGVFLIGGERTSILSALEPITGVIIGIVVFHESCKLNILVGSVLVIAAAVLIAFADLKAKKASEE